ncbi:MAG: cytochrome c maturation protein CcmE [Pseudomonadota bacterium]
MMKRKHKRISLLFGGGAALAVATALILNALGQSTSFFVTPDELASRVFEPGQALRLGGLVEPGSVKRSSSSASVAFVVSSGGASVRVLYTGLLPDLFREGQGVVAEGVLLADGSFAANRVLAKHDETYMPPELAEKLKDSGDFRPARSLQTPDI